MAAETDTTKELIDRVGLLPVLELIDRELALKSSQQFWFLYFSSQDLTARDLLKNFIVCLSLVLKMMS